MLNVRDFDENLLKSYSEKVLIPENSCIHLKLDVNKFVKEFDKAKIRIEMQLIENDEVIAQRNLYLVYPKYLMSNS